MDQSPESLHSGHGPVGQSGIGPARIVVGITGASGAAYARRTVELAAAAGWEVHVSITSLGRRLLAEELGLKRIDADALSGGRGERLVIHNDNDLGASIASGSFLHRGMIVVPASSNTIAAVAAGITDSLVQRAASVTLKQRRTLILAHRESPLSLIDIRNMERLSLAGAIVAPCNPGFYLNPTTVDEIVDFVAGRLVDLVGVPHDLDIRWETGRGRAGPKDGPDDGPNDG
ncbi:MAG: UbiX family flavin prenyltransferase [Phycisphaerales bacterium]